MTKQVFNPFLPLDEYIPDGEPKVFGERLYLFGSHDQFDGKSYCMNHYQGWSASIHDLTDWTNAGTIYRKDQDVHNPEGVRNMFAPDAAQGPDGRYYLYYTLDLAGKAGVMSVAVSDTPDGKYAYYGDVKFANGEVLGSQDGELLNYDPSIFIDEDGRIYLYTGIAVPDLSGLKKKVDMLNRLADGCYVVELEADMLTMKHVPKKIFGGMEEAKGTEFAGHAFFEAASMRKISDQYYFIYCSERSHELCYAISSSPTAGFRYGGVIISIGDIGYNGRTAEEATNYYGNTHGSIENVNGQWYIFYHRHTNLNQFSRQACAEKITIEADGSIKQVEMTSCGLNPDALDGAGKYPAQIACNLSARKGTFAYAMFKPKEVVDPYYTQENRDGEVISYIANMRDGSFAGYKYFNFDQPASIEIIYRGEANGTLEVYSDEKHTKIGEFKLTPAIEWASATATLSAIVGTKPLFFHYRGEGSLDFSRFEINP